MIRLISTTPLVLVVTDPDVASLPTLDAGAAYTRYLHSLAGPFPEQPLGNYVTAVQETINPRAASNREKIFEYVDLRDVDQVYGYVVRVRSVPGRMIGSTKVHFRSGDILYAKIMPSLANRKVALVSQPVVNGAASTEFIVLRPNLESNMNPFYLFRALRSDHFVRQAVAIVTGATGRQRITPSRLLQLRILVPPEEIRREIGDVVEREFSLRMSADALAQQAEDQSAQVFGAEGGPR